MTRRRSTSRDELMKDERARELTGGGLARESADMPVDFDRLVHSRAVARAIAQMLWDHERRRAADAAGSQPGAKGGDEVE